MKRSVPRLPSLVLPWVLGAAMVLVVAPGVRGEVAPVYVEDSPAAHELTHDAMQLLSEGRTVDALAKLQRVLLEYPNKLMPVGDGRFVDAALWVQRTIRENPELLAAYERLYDPTAERLVQDAMTPVADADRLAAVMREHLLTPAGLEASLTLAGLYLERADGSAAASVLDAVREHPQLARHAKRYQTLRAVAALLEHDEPTYDAARARLVELGATDAAKEVAAVKNRLHPALAAQPSDAELIDAGPRPVELDEPLWERPMSGASRTVTRRVVRKPFATRVSIDSAVAFSAVPVADDTAIYLNMRDSVLAVDRASNRLLWEYDWANDLPQGDAPALISLARQVPDRRGMAVTPSMVIGVMGMANTRGRRVMTQGAAGTMLVALGRERGERKWSVSPDELDASLDRAFFHGTPLVVDGRVFAILRRSQASGFQDVFIVAFALDSGVPLWRRHLSSTVTTSRYAIGPAAEMTHSSGRLYVCDNIGAAAALDVRTGAMLWVSVLAEDKTSVELAMTRGERGTGVVGPPVHLRAGLFVPLSTPTSRAFILDPDTGRKVKVLGGPEWDGMAYFLPGEGSLLGVGSAIRRFDGETLKQVWEAALSSEDAAPRGVASVTKRFVLVNTSERLFAIDLASGETLLEQPIDTTGNLVALPDQVLLASAETLTSFMPWEVALGRLRADIEAHPADPAPAMGLAHLAAETDQPGAMLEGVDQALAAIGNLAADPDAKGVAEARSRVFEELLQLADQASGLDFPARDALFERVAATTSSPSDEVAYHLEHGAFLEERGDPAGAVEHYQSVLAEPVLASKIYHGGTVRRRAGLEARERVRRIVQERGPAVYAKFASLAKMRLGEFEIRAERRPDLYIRLADQYPLAPAALKARTIAGQLLTDAERWNEAIAQYRRAYRLCETPEQVARISGEVAEAYVAMGRPSRASRWLKSVRREHPGVDPLRGGQPFPMGTWLAELSMSDAVREALPAFDLASAQPLVLPGTPLRARAGATIDWRDWGILLQSDGKLRRHALSGELVWEAKVADEALEVVGFQQDCLVLWAPASATLIGLDATTGEAAWAQLPLGDVLAEMGQQDREAVRPAEAREFMEMIDAGPMVVRNGRVVVDDRSPAQMHRLAITESLLCVVDQLGRTVAIDPLTGEVRWRAVAAIDRVARIDATEDVLILAGVTGLGTDAQSGVLVVLDLLTGEQRFPPLEDREPPQWVGLAADNLIVTATSQEIAGYHAESGEVAWRLSIDGPPLTGEGWITPSQVVLADNAGSALVIDPARGELTARVGLTSRGAVQIRDGEAVEHRTHLISNSDVVTLGERGEVAWRGASGVAGMRLEAQRISEQAVIVLARGFGPMPEVAPAEHLRLERLREPPPRLYIAAYDRANGKLLALRGVDEPNALGAASQAVLGHGALLLPLGPNTLVLRNQP